jgi:nucleoid-associated protein YgaU
MLFKGSRYSATEIVEVTGPDGRVSRTLALRTIVPEASALEHTVAEGERLDNLAAGFYGDPTRYWLILDANPDTLNPFELLEPGAAIHVPRNRLVAT